MSPPIDVNVNVDVTIVAPADQAANDHAEAIRAARARSKPGWLQLVIADVPNPDTAGNRPTGGSALHARLEVDRGLIGVSKDNVPVYWIAGVDVGRSSTTALDASDQFNTIVATDTQAMMYGGIALGSTRFEDQIIAGAGIEHSAGTVYGGFPETAMPLSSNGPVVELMDVMMLRVHGPLAVVAGVGILGHLARYPSPDGMPAFMRDPNIEMFGGFAVATN